MKKMINAKRRKVEILFCVLAILFMVFLTMKANGLYIDPEKAAFDAQRLEGYDPFEKILFQKDSELGDRRRYYVGLGKQPEKREFVSMIDEQETMIGKEVKRLPVYYDKEGYLIIVELAKGLLWRVEDVRTEYFHIVPIHAYYQEDMQMMLGLCLHPEVTEVTMKWGHWMEDAEGNWFTYDMGKATYPIGEDGFFYQEVDTSKRLKYEDGSVKSIQCTYLEGRDKNGNVLYRDGIDDEGNCWIGDYDYGMKKAD